MIKAMYFGAEHCIQCRVFRPKVEDVCKQKGYEFQFIDADDDNNAPILSVYNVRSIPYVVILKDGTLVDKGLAVDILKIM